LARRVRRSQDFAVQAANSINDWYPEKVNQAFSSVAAAPVPDIPQRQCFLPAREIGVAFPHAKS
jgi:hypothetical protein